MDEKIIQILEHTQTLFQKYGIRSLTMSDIARENMVSKKTLYNYVSDKADLVEKVLHRHFFVNKVCIDDLTDGVTNAVEEVFALQRMLVQIIKEHNPSVEFDLRKYYPQIYHKLMIEKSRELYTGIKQNIVRGKKEGLYRSDIDADLVAKSRVLFQTQRVDNEVVSFKDFTNTYALKQMMLYHMRAICTEQGLKIVEREINEFNEDKENED
jgi:AcrR family transcriptional regulator